MDNDGHIQGGQLDDELDDEELDNILMYVVLLGFMFFFQDTHQQVPRRRRVRDSALSGRDYVLEIINGHEDRIIQNMRLDVPRFLLLCDLLLNRGYWHAYPSQRVGVHESVALTLMCLSHDERHRVLAERFQHSTETIDRHVRRVLRALVRLGRDLVRPRNVDDTHPRILNNGLLMPWFRDCVGALDGTHVSAWCRAEVRERFRNRHGDLSQNILAACDHDMRFVFVRVGWEGSAHDARILQETLLDPGSGFPMPPQGKYYAVDAAYRNMPGFMAPFRGARGTPHERAAKALFNRRHASVRNIIERTFGVLKKRFPILKGPMQNYLIATQNNIVLACCALHNFMRDYVPNDEYFNEEAINGAFADAHIAGEQVQMGQPIDMSQQGIDNWNEDRRAMAAHMYVNANN
ncbi:protein ALP1-like [Coffea arabica]|uniref:Protein ALP1-like n=1 Tax=Coffea arabica TaxID=13443 RepID=A0ABM4X095_COFAR|nr:putative nuclease HARBI1 [Coffea arabica]